MKKSLIIILCVFCQNLLFSQAPMDNLLGKYYGFEIQTDFSIPMSSTCTSANLTIKPTGAYPVISMMDSCGMNGGGVPGTHTANNDSTIRDYIVASYIYGRLYPNDSLYLKYNYACCPNIQMEFFGFKKKASFIMINPSSTISCSSNNSVVNFSISNVGTPPYNFTVYVPGSCSGSFTTQTSNPNPSFTVNCVGTYTIITKDIYYTNMGVFTHTVSSCIGIDELSLLQSIVLSPNPAYNNIYLQNSGNVEIMELNLITIEGKEMPLLQKEKNEFDVSILPEGLYFLQLQTKEGVLTRKIIIQK